MTFLEALYGSQYAEINGRGGDASKGRMNGNLFLSAFAMICLFIVLSILVHLGKLVITANDLPAGMSGKTTGKLLAIPLIALFYYAFSKTIGSEENYNNYVKRYADCSEAEKAGANKKILVPFFVALGIWILLMFI